MSSVKIHRDLFNFERKRKGFTTRQITGLAAGAATAAAATAFLAFAVGLPLWLAVNLGLLPAFPMILAGFLPLFGMPADEYARRFCALRRRGPVLVRTGEEAQPPKGDTTREHKRAKKRKGYECQEGAPGRKGGMRALPGMREGSRG